MGATKTGHFSITVGDQFRKGGPIVGVAVAAIAQGHTATQPITVQLETGQGVQRAQGRRDGPRQLILVHVQFAQIDQVSQRGG
jgi:hypothetical protein